MEEIRSLAAIDRPREKLQRLGVKALSDEELLAILLGSGSTRLTLAEVCNGLLAAHDLKGLAQMDLAQLCAFKGIGPAKATILLAAAEYCRRAQTGTFLKSGQDYYEFLKPMLLPAPQLRYTLLLMSVQRELLAFADAGSVLPGIAWITGLAIKCGAKRIVLGRNGWGAFSNAEARWLGDLQSTCAALNITCDGLMAVGPERYKMI